MSTARSRMELLGLAQNEGVPTPETVAVAEEKDLAAAVELLGLPLVLKADASSGGQGVRVAFTVGDARRAWRALHRPPSLVRAVKRGFVSDEWTHLRPWARRMTRRVSAQQFIPGNKERTSMAVCREGEVVAFVCLEVMQTWYTRGSSSVVRIVEDEAMELAMRRVAGRLRISGFCGFDFVVDQGSGRPLLIEMNPRPTQLAHLPLGPGRDLLAAYVREILGRPEVQDRPAVTTKDMIAVFPQELLRDSESELIREAYHDVPWDAPKLIRRVLNPVPRVLTEDARWRG